MSTNTQLQKIRQPRIRRLRHRNRLIASSTRLQGRHASLDNYLIREAARAIAAPLRLIGETIAAGGNGYSVGDRFIITGGTFSIPAVGIVSEVSAGVVTGGRIIDGGEYTLVTPPASATTVIKAKNGTTPGTGLTVTESLTSAVAGVTEAEILDAIRNDSNVAGTVPTFVGADTFRDRRNSSVKYEAAGVPIS